MSSRSGTHRIIFTLVTGLALTVSAARGDEPQGPPSTPTPNQAQGNYQGVAELFTLVSQEAGQQARPAENLSEFWIGVAGNSVDSVFRLHLDLPENQGMLITEVIADSPAARAGLKTNDVLVMAGEKPIKESADLAALIGEKKESLLALRLIRAGKPIIVEITPARRPASQTGETCPAISKASDAEFVNRVYLELTGAVADAEKARKFAEDKEADKRAKLVNRLLRNSTVTNKSCTACHSTDDASIALSRRLLGFHLLSKQDGQWASDWNPSVTALQLSYPHPGIILTDGTVFERTSGPAGLPDDVTITITRKGQNPTQITVRRGEQIWDATADNYRDKLPEDVRPLADRWMIGTGDGHARLALNRWLNAGQASSDAAELTAQALSVQILDNQSKANAEVNAARMLLVEQEIESLNQQLSQIQQTLAKLRKSLHDSPEKPADPAKK